MSNSTEQELRLFLARQLPDKIQIYTTTNGPCSDDPDKILDASFQWKGPTVSILNWIKPTEWDYVVRLAEEKLPKFQQFEYIKELHKHAPCHQSDHLDVNRFCVLASWQSRTTALMKLKIEQK